MYPVHIPIGEPYKLLGNKMVLAGWQYIRPCSLAWMNDKNENVSVVGRENEREAWLSTRH